ncbi:hypothetical protein GNI_089080 [Gregarina niphandrodes]|uniref:Uncharacterized protein n=1 Tax=Gregarina niphandrodes TaxID=110365 RepID=A0A023B5M3_GRENI|nr:hypothetical protein GNI_089080 [Gregarina niphandrodes]EZG61408.1 hypothetical protein GNI_089080 [Gregarina niphandrodes]|eukprot:XP_011130768.1 hypothetical protein GNI_089080 [Gregarina niphandrodes]
MVLLKLKANPQVVEVTCASDDVSIPDNVELVLPIYEEAMVQLHKLVESNEQMAEYDPHKKDQDVQLAIAENRLAVIRRENLMERCMNKLQQLDPDLWGLLKADPAAATKAAAATGAEVEEETEKESVNYFEESVGEERAES